MTKTISINDTIFGTNLTVFICGDKDRTKLIKGIEKHIEAPLKESDVAHIKDDTVRGHFNTYTVDYDDGTTSIYNIIVVFNDSLKEVRKILCHELSHYVFRTLSSRGIQHIEDTDEVYAYYIGGLFSHFMNVYDDLSKKGRKNANNRSKHR